MDDSSRSIRRVRSVSLWTFWLNLIAIPFLSPFNILSRMIFFGDALWFVGPVVAAIVAVVAIIVYFVALALGRAQARDEFATILTGKAAARPRPIVLLLLPFDFAEPGVKACRQP
jgi:hypothetical protein